MTTIDTFTYPDTLADLASLRWQEIPEGEYESALGAVPPARGGRSAFALGERMTQLDDVPGKAGDVYRMYVRVGDRFFTKPDLLTAFNPDAYRRQIAEG